MAAQFADLALAGLKRLFPDEHKRLGVASSIEWKLTRDSGFQSRPIRTFPGRAMRIGRLYAGIEIRILFEVTDRLHVWSIAPAPPDATG